MQAPKELLYSTDHEWVRVEKNDEAVVGITAYAQGELGDVVYVDIENRSKEIIEGDTFGTIEAVKTVSDLRMPVSGRIIEINAQMEEYPELVNSDPYGDGWMVRIKLSRPQELKQLMDAKAYQAHTDASSDE